MEVYPVLTGPLRGLSKSMPGMGQPLLLMVLSVEKEGEDIHHSGHLCPHSVRGTALGLKDPARG